MQQSAIEFLIAILLMLFVGGREATIRAYLATAKSRIGRYAYDYLCLRGLRQSWRVEQFALIGGAAVGVVLLANEAIESKIAAKLDFLSTTSHLTDDSKMPSDTEKAEILDQQESLKQHQGAMVISRWVGFAIVSLTWLHVVLICNAGETIHRQLSCTSNIINIHDRRRLNKELLSVSDRASLYQFAEVLCELEVKYDLPPSALTSRIRRPIG